MTRSASGEYLLSTTLTPRKEATPEVTVIAFAVREVIRPSEEDDRSIGAAFAELRILPDRDGKSAMNSSPATPSAGLEPPLDQSSLSPEVSS